MAKTKSIKSIFECQNCGFNSTKWLGKCPSCNSWDSLVEIKDSTKIEYITNTSLNSLDLAKAEKITDIKEESFHAFSSFQSELDLVLGGGILQGGLYLIGGSPGVGKSTLLLKMAGDIAKSGKKVLYVSGEESAHQIKKRASRCDALSENLFLLSQIELEQIKLALNTDNYEVCIIDSIQTLYSPNLSAAPGSVSQVREITFELMRLTKTKNLATFIIGHITKDGTIAGPRVLEHMVDSVLYFEGDKNSQIKILRSFKNRFGSTSDIGIFEMTQKGLISAKDANKQFFHQKKDLPGSAATVIMEGSRALVVEIQALVSSNEYGMPKRLANGFDSNRLNMLLALLEKKLQIGLGHYDVFINVAGGIKISQTSADLALIACVLSSFKNRSLKHSSAFLGEVSLVGDIRPIPNVEIILKELASFGFKNVLLPYVPPNIKTSLNCIEVTEVAQIIDWM
ncbi:DNA repair protein RadA [Helicobacter sp. 11S02629-2]|uniref:DNA repair protein RadA n=1 Tax=Helicobacter sp. 11S02629-2 TaxID=1476195 RepID=UPI000BA6DD79|nr:DNA repair protein RadA [Helicobacter sp. 11S02629-2]PAF45333.1 DNA repair protein RadA [Helicobacter sp. 11S02629-2]